MNYTINFDHQITIFFNEFSATLGQITAGTISTILLLPIYNLYTSMYNSSKNHKKID